MNLSLLMDNYISHLSIEHGFSENTLNAYGRDVQEFFDFAGVQASITQITSAQIECYLADCLKRDLTSRTIARKLSSIKSFFRFVILENIIQSDPTEDVSVRCTSHKLPKVVNLQWIDRLFETPDTATVFGIRDRAILETLYSSGLRVSELIGLKLFDLNFTHGFIRCLGKGSKERFVPAGRNALSWIERYIQDARPAFLGPSRFVIFSS